MVSHYQQNANMKKILGIVVLGLLLSGNAYAAGVNGLKGLKDFDLEVRINEECGVTTELIKNSIKYILSSSKIKLKELSASVLFLDAVVMDDPTGCSGHYSLSVHEWHSTENSANELVLAVLLLWDDSSTLKGAPDGFSRRFITSIENATKKFVVDWSEKN